MLSLYHLLQFKLLKAFFPLGQEQISGVPERHDLTSVFGENFPKEVQNKIVVDFGCGLGADTQQLAQWGAQKAIGLEIRDEIVQANNQRVGSEHCQFYTSLPQNLMGQVDMILSVDAFEHFDKPQDIIQIMYAILKNGGKACISFGPTWYHPRGGHLFSVFPWAHLLLSETSLLKWRSLYIHDGAQKFTQVAGGLNKMSIAQFEEIVKSSKFKIEKLDCRPAKGIKLIQMILGRERGTSLVNATLIKP